MFLVKTTLSHQLSYWFFRIYWLRHSITPASLHKIAVVVSVFLGVVIAAQFVYPSSWTLPQTRIGGVYYGFQSKDEIAQKINEQNYQVMHFELEKQTIATKPSDVGLTVDGERSVQTDYSWRDRLVPFSLLFTKHYRPYSLGADKTKILSFANSLAQFDQAPVEGSLKFSGAEVMVSESKDGFRYDSVKVAEDIADAKLDSQLIAEVKPSIVEPTIDTIAAEQAAEQVKQRLATPMSIKAVGRTIDIDAPTLASWTTLTPDAASKKLLVGYDRVKIKEKLMSLSPYVYIAQTPNVVTMLDGAVDGSSGGSKGQALVVEASIDNVIKAASTNSAIAEASVQPITPQTQIVRKYSKTSKGLQSLVDYWAQSHGGQYGVVLKRMDGSIAASYNANKRFTSASIYKLYLAYVVYSKVNAGTMSLDSTTSTGQSVSTCIDAMIVRSDNSCAIALGNAVGWQANDGMIHDKGFGSTTLTSGGHLTTAADTAEWLRALQSGTLTSGGYNDSLLSMMKRQIYRSGIPAGSAGSVANKVGFIDGLNHDAAIVYHPSGTYVLTILTSGSSFSNIADLARQISQVLSQ